jgi:N-acetylmuramoyl-L-alanine amidase
MNPKKKIKEDVDMPSVSFKMPPPSAYVQTVDNRPSKDFANYYKVQQLKEAETVVATLILEAGGEGRKGMEAVNEVLHNRARKQGKTLYQIAVAPKQFSCFNAGVEPAVQRAKKHPKWAEAIDILQKPLTNHTYGADHYHTLKVKPSWGPRLKKMGYGTVVIGNHIFYYPGKKK